MKDKLTAEETMKILVAHTEIITQMQKDILTIAHCISKLRAIVENLPSTQPTH